MGQTRKGAVETVTGYESIMPCSKSIISRLQITLYR